MKLKTLPDRVKLLDNHVTVVTPGSWRGDKRTANQRGYNYRWQKYRKGWLRQHPLCGDRLAGSSAEHSRCVRDGRATAATDVDHIVPHRGDQALFWNPENHQSLCGLCHDSFKPQFETNLNT